VLTTMRARLLAPAGPYRPARVAAVVACALVLVLLWSNTRILVLRKNQDPARPTVLSAYPVYHGMAVALGEGRPGQVDLARLRAYVALANPFAEYPRAGGAPEFVDYYSLDIGYSFIVELARLAFPTLPDNHLRSLALQLATDSAMPLLLCFLFARWRAGLGLAAALLYTCNKVFIQLVSVPFYYYWDVPVAFAVLGALLLSLERPEVAGRILGMAGLLLGFAVWLRASWWPITAFLFVLLLATPALRRKVLPAMLLFAVVAAPQVWRSSRARGHLALSTRATWHVAVVGLGYYENAYGFQANDEFVFRLTREKYGVPFRMDDYGPQDEAARKEYLDVLRKDPGFVVRSFLGRLSESVSGTTTTSMSPLPGLRNPAYPLLCLAGLVLMVLRGGARRTLGLAAAGVYVIYVGLTSLFYFVGLAYDSVSQVALFVLMMGLLDSGAHLVGVLLRDGRAMEAGRPASG
jgi:hypothetical protein